MLRALSIAMWVALGLLGGAGPADAQSVPVGVATTLSLVHAGQTRTYIVYVPRSLASVSSRSAVLLLHGNGGSGVGIMGVSRLNALAESEGFVAVYPETPGGRAWSDGRAAKAGNDDVGFIVKVVDALVRSNSVDASQVYASGASSGGFMTERLACEASTTFVAVAVVSALLTQELGQTCAPTRNLPMVYFSGTADAVVPFGGANWVMSQPATRDFWKARGGCTSTTGPVAQPDQYADGTTLTLERIERCARTDERLDFYVIQGGGHTWPGAISGGSARNGVTSQEIKTTDTMVAFFIRYGLARPTSLVAGTPAAPRPRSARPGRS